jgi:hypothetical protein
MGEIRSFWEGEIKKMSNGRTYQGLQVKLLSDVIFLSVELIWSNHSYLRDFYARFLIKVIFFK